MGSSATRSTGLVHERAREGDALLLATGKLLGKRGQAVVKLHEAQRLVGAAPALGRGHAEEFLHVRHVVENGPRRQELVVLEDDPHRAAESRDA